MGVIAVFAGLVLAHLLGDFPLQTEWLYQIKVRSRWGLVIHVAVHLALTVLVVRIGGRDALLLLILGVTHYGLDWLKMAISFRPHAVGFVLDQVMHTLILVTLALLWPHLTVRLPWDWLLLALLLASIPAWLMFGWVLTGDVLHYWPGKGWAQTLNEITFTLSKRSGLTVAGALAVVWLLAVFWYLP